MMIGHEAREVQHSLHDQLASSLRRNSELEAEVLLLKKTSRILLDKIETLNLDLGIKGDRTWQD